MKPLKKAMAIAVAFFSNKPIKKDDESCRRLLLIPKHR